MFLIYPRDEEWYTVYIERSRNQPNDKHAGQISLPGGKVESSDADYAAAACRELEEEIGVPRSTVEVVRPLSELYVIPSNFMVYPYIGVINYTPDFVLQQSEVESIIEISLAEVRALSVTRDDLDVRGQAMRDVPYYDLNGHVLWGATSMITAEFKQLLDDTDLV
jgi:8-oxo-dGTP pyrophosphatase MutT (NUDIX family)